MGVGGRAGVPGAGDVKAGGELQEMVNKEVPNRRRKGHTGGRRMSD